MVVQLTYDQTPAVAYAGMLAEEFSERQVDSYLAVSPVADLVAGQAVERGADPEAQCKQLASLIGWFGVALASYQDQEVPGGGSITYVDGSSVPVMYRGRIWVLASAAVTLGAEVIPGVAADSGKFAAGAGTGNTKAYARSAAGADGDLLLIELVAPVAA
jgi:hypothetical protein